MLFVNRNWELFTVDGNLSASLDALLCLVMSCMNLQTSPKPVAWLVDLLMSTSMIALKRQHPVSILSTGCARYCKHSRTEAIMSVLGATNWHKEVLKQGSSGSDAESLTLGRYEYSFLKERRDRGGFVF